MRLRTAYSLLFLIIICSGCSSEIKEELTFRQTPTASFIYQLQDAELDELLESDAEIIVIDIDDSEFSEQEIASLVSDGKKVLSYLSIGEAEEYRDYWKKEWNTDPPEWLDRENPGWEGNYKVRYWNVGWQDIISRQLAKIIDRGYSGAYLDIVDAYEFYEELGQEDARQEMIDFIVALAKDAKEQDKGFLIVPQNALELIGSEEYLQTIDGVGKEDTWYDDNDPVPAAEREECIHYLDLIRDAGKIVLVIDYPAEKTRQCEFLNKAHAKDYTSTVGNRELDRIQEIECP